MIIGTVIKVDTGTLTIRKFYKDGKNSMVTCWLDSLVGKEYCLEVTMSERNLKNLMKT